MSFRFPEGIVRHYDVSPTDPEIHSLAQFLTSSPVTRDLCSRYQLDIPGSLGCLSITLLNSFTPDFTQEWDHKGVLTVFYIMGA